MLTEKAELKAQIEEDYKVTLAKNAKEMEDMKSSFEERLKEAQATGSLSYGVTTT
jgi:hypothetical protein